MSDPRKAAFDAVSAICERNPFNIAGNIAALHKILDDGGAPRKGDGAAIADPDWLAEARRLIGQREIPGPSHNGWIARGWARLGAGWYNDDETPWCGFFVAHCMDAAGLEYPGGGLFARARAWMDWGKPCGELYGAVAVFGRTGGGHVGFVAGASDSSLYILGGNQSNAVSIAPIPRSRLLGFRWPAGRALAVRRPPRMSGGTVSRNEA